MFFKEKFVRDSVKEFCRLMQENYTEWRQWEYSFSNSSKWYNIWTANWIFHIRIEWQKWLNILEKKYINDSIQKTINKQLEDKDFIINI